MIYLDYNATTPVRPEVREAMLPYLSEEWGNPSNTYAFGARLKKPIETAREQVAELIGAQPWEVFFTSCAPESNNSALNAALKDPKKKHVITSNVEYCLADSDKPSHVVRAVKPDRSASRQAVRFSAGPTNTISEIESTVATVRHAVVALNS